MSVRAISPPGFQYNLTNELTIKDKNKNGLWINIADNLIVLVYPDVYVKINPANWEFYDYDRISTEIPHGSPINNIISQNFQLQSSSTYNDLKRMHELEIPPTERGTRNKQRETTKAYKTHYINTIMNFEQKVHNNYINNWVIRGQLESDLLFLLKNASQIDNLINDLNLDQGNPHDERLTDDIVRKYFKPHVIQAILEHEHRDQIIRSLINMIRTIHIHNRDYKIAYMDAGTVAHTIITNVYSGGKHRKYRRHVLHSFLRRVL